MNMILKDLNDTFASSNFSIMNGEINEWSFSNPHPSYVCFALTHPRILI